MQKILLAALLLIGFNCFGQKTERFVIAHEDPFDLHATFGKDSTTLFYEKLVPKGRPEGVLVILPGGGESVEDVKKQISLHTLAVQKKLVGVDSLFELGYNQTRAGNPVFGYDV